MKNAASTIRNLLAIGFITIIFVFGSTGLYAQPTMAHHVQTKESQAATTPAAALQRLKDGNLRFLSDSGLHHGLYRKEISETAHGQFPFAAILSCIDSRVTVEDIFDLENGDAFNARVAGSTFGPIDLGGLEYATKVSGAKVLLVLGHTSCGAIKGACDDVHLGSATSRIGANSTGCDTELSRRVKRWSADREERTCLDEVVHRIDAVLCQVYGSLSQAAYRRTAYTVADDSDAGL